MSGCRHAGIERRGSGDPYFLSEPELVDHFFRHEYGRLVATLTRWVGSQHIEDVEDATQVALMTALDRWKTELPADPAAWLFCVARNNLLETMRRRTIERRIVHEVGLEQSSTGKTAAEDSSPSDSNDIDLLRMLFLCCDESIPIESQVVFALKTLCGFDVREIAFRLFTTEANIYKRFSRARIRLREVSPTPDDFTTALQESKLPAVHKTLYLLFTEGYLSLQPENALRRELCEEAIRLATILVQHRVGSTPETFALLALMNFHVARMASRQDEAGALLLLEEQNRGSWDQCRIQAGLEWLARSAQGNCFSRYHAEAGIAAEHCLAPSFQKTRWDVIVECYAMLEQIAPSPIHRLNRAVAVAELHGPASGLAILEGFEPTSWLAGSHLLAAVLADLHHRCGNREAASRYREAACEAAPTNAIRDLLGRRFYIQTLTMLPQPVSHTPAQSAD